MTDYNVLLMERLVPYLSRHDPWTTTAGFRVEMVAEAASAKLEMYSTARDYMSWTAEQHASRVRAIMENAAWYDDPISVDNECSGMYIYPIPIILDGWHRLYAHIAKGDRTIRAHYGGRVDLLRYLEGKRKSKPEE